MMEQTEQDKEQQQLHEVANAGQQVHDLVQLPGWRMVLAPWLVRTREAALTQLLRAKEHTELVAYQQRINAINQFLSLIEQIQSDGRAATQQLAETPG